MICPIKHGTLTSSNRGKSVPPYSNSEADHQALNARGIEGYGTRSCQTHGVSSVEVRREES
jgi:hypothetical protein